MHSSVRSLKWSFSFGFIAVLLLAQVLLPVVHAISCDVRLNSFDYPLKVQPSTVIELRTKLTATCTQSAIPISGRADLIDSETGQVLSISHFFLGYVANSQGAVVNETVSNSAQAPRFSGIWQPTVEVRLTVGEGTTFVGLAKQPLTILVGEMGQTAFTASISFGNSSLGTNVTQTYVQVSSNSTIPGLHFDPARRLINFTVNGPGGTNGSTALIFKKSLIQGSPVVTIDNGNITARILSVTTNSTYYLLIFSYPHSEHGVAVGGSETVAELNLGILQFLFPILVAAASAAMGCSKRRAPRLNRQKRHLCNA
jgi:hypothetical protein